MVQESDINFRTLAYEVNDGIYICDLDGKFIYANLALADIFGFERPADIIGRNIEEFFSPERGKAFMNQFWKSMESGKGSTLLTGEINRLDGKTALIEVNPMPFIKNRKLLGCQGVVHDITERVYAEKRMMYRATHDSLTGIYNRTFFEAEMKRLERGRQFPISIMIVNVEILKNAVDSEDHEDGDKLNKRVAHMLFHSFRGDDIVARIGEDQFAILLPNVDQNAVDEIVKRIRIDLLEINTNQSEPTLAFFIGAGTTKKEESLNSALEQAQAIARLEKKKNKPA
jgi:diguanylate cyclase (GGDEF)-like protein/PAS domain S-box-containing protein